MNVEIISIGDELLDGSVLEKNANFISNKLKKYSIIPQHISIVGDDVDKITKLITTAKKRSDLIFITGGLGPTGDDITRNAVSKAFNLELIFHSEIKENIKKRLKEFHVQHTDNNDQQAMIPKGAKILNNKNGTAPGFIIDKNETTCICIPGVPHEMKPIVNNQVLTYLDLENEKNYQQKLYFKGIGEAQLEDKIYSLIEIPKEVFLSFVVKGSHILVKIDGKDKKIVEKITKKIKEKLNQNIFEDLNLIEAIYNMMINNKLSLSTAESCTGGLLGNRITNLSGSSVYYLGGLVVYSNQLKVNLLNIDKDIIKIKGAVSNEVAEHMAKNIKDITNSDYGIGITGIAGPKGGTEQKPVGTVYIGVSGPKFTEVKKYQLKGKRKQIKYLSTEFALKNLKYMLFREGYHEKK